MKRSKIADIAHITKLSSSTVSRALNNHPHISQKTKNKILRCAKELNYTPSLLGRGLSKNRTFILGLLVSDFRPYFSALAEAIQDEAEKFGYYVVVFRTNDEDKKLDSSVKSMMNIGVEGILCACCKLSDPTIENLIDENFPVVLLNRRLKKDKGDQIIYDHEYGAVLLTNHLIRLGYKRIGMIGGPKNFSSGHDQFKGFIEALTKSGMKIHNELIKEGTFSMHSGYNLAKELMHASKPPEAIYCCDDHAALGAWKYLCENNFRVPDDVALVGHDDIEFSSHPLVELTTAKTNLKKMGEIAVQSLVGRINKEHKSFKKYLLEPHLIIRKSCGYNLRRADVKF